MIEFTEIVGSLISEVSAAVEPRLCPDQFVGIVNDLNKTQSDFTLRLPADSRPQGLPCLILVLESPHTSEFIGAPGPAKGSTGRLIRSHINEMKCFRQYPQYGLILMNAIRNQCSLGYKTTYFRDEVFRRVWGAYGKENFCSRVSGIFREGDAIANCCTKGKTNECSLELRVVVQSALKYALPNVEPMRRTHPSSWYSERNRKSEWSYSCK